MKDYQDIGVWKYAGLVIEIQDPNPTLYHISLYYLATVHHI